MSPLQKAWSNVHAVQRTCGTAAASVFLGGITRNLPEVIRSRTLVPGDRAMAGREWTFNLQRTSIALDGRLFSAAREMYCRQVYFPSADYDLRPGRLVVDLGANVGLFSLLTARVGCTVLAIEAQRGFVREIDEHAARLGLADRITTINALIGAGVGVLADPEAFRAASHSEGHRPPLIAMDELLARHGVERVDFLKIDIEGSEFDLLRGDTGWLGKVDRIAMEVHPEYGSAATLQATLEAHGLRAELRDNALRSVAALGADGGYLFARRAS